MGWEVNTYIHHWSHIRARYRSLRPWRPLRRRSWDLGLGGHWVSRRRILSWIYIVVSYVFSLSFDGRNEECEEEDLRRRNPSTWKVNLFMGALRDEICNGARYVSNSALTLTERKALLSIQKNSRMEAHGRERSTCGNLDHRGGSRSRCLGGACLVAQRLLRIRIYTDISPWINVWIGERLYLEFAIVVGDVICGRKCRVTKNEWGWCQEIYKRASKLYGKSKFPICLGYHADFKVQVHVRSLRRSGGFQGIISLVYFVYVQEMLQTQTPRFYVGIF